MGNRLSKYDKGYTATPPRRAASTPALGDASFVQGLTQTDTNVDPILAEGAPLVQEPGSFVDNRNWFDKLRGQSNTAASLNNQLALERELGNQSLERAKALESLHQSGVITAEQLRQGNVLAAQVAQFGHSQQLNQQQGEITADLNSQQFGNNDTLNRNKAALDQQGEFLKARYLASAANGLYPTKEADAFEGQFNAATQPGLLAKANTVSGFEQSPEGVNSLIADMTARREASGITNNVNAAGANVNNSLADLNRAKAKAERFTTVAPGAALFNTDTEKEAASNPHISNAYVDKFDPATGTYKSMLSRSDTSGRLQVPIKRTATLGMPAGAAGVSPILGADAPVTPEPVTPEPAPQATSTKGASPGVGEGAAFIGQGLNRVLQYIQKDQEDAKNMPSNINDWISAARTYHDPRSGESPVDQALIPALVSALGVKPKQIGSSIFNRSPESQVGSDIPAFLKQLEAMAPEIRKPLLMRALKARPGMPDITSPAPASASGATPESQGVAGILQKLLKAKQGLERRKQPQP